MSYKFIEHMNQNFHREILYLRYPQEISKLENDKIAIILQDNDFANLIVKECFNKGMNNKKIGFFSVSGDYYIVKLIEFTSLIQDRFSCNKLVGTVEETYRITTLK